LTWAGRLDPALAVAIEHVRWCRTHPEYRITPAVILAALGMRPAGGERPSDDMAVWALAAAWRDLGPRGGPAG
jgi:hypothetical protein